MMKIQQISPYFCKEDWKLLRQLAASSGDCDSHVKCCRCKQIAADILKNTTTLGIAQGRVVVVVMNVSLNRGEKLSMLNLLPSVVLHRSWQILETA